MQASVVLTGFETFGEHASNPSGAFALAATASLAASGYDAHHALLPVTWEAAARAPYDLSPAGALLIHCGLAAGRDGVHLERGADNRAGSTPDNDGVVAQGDLEEGAPARLTTSLDLDALARALTGELSSANTLTPLRAHLSDDAGDYVCNAIYYRALQARSGEALFVHIQQMTSADAARAGRAFAAALASILGSGHTAGV